MRAYNKNKIDLTEKPGTIGYVLKQNADKIWQLKSAIDIQMNLEVLFKENNIDTPVSKRIITDFKTKRMSLFHAQKYVADVLLSAMNQAVIR